MKKISKIFGGMTLVAVTAVSLAACGGGSESKTETSASSTSAEVTTQSASTDATTGTTVATTTVATTAQATTTSKAVVKNPDMKSGFYFETNSGALILSDENTTQVYVNGVMEGDYYALERLADKPDIIQTLVTRTNEIKDFLKERTVKAPEVVSFEINGRNISGLEYMYSAVDGSKTLCGAEYYEEHDGKVYCWSAIYDKVNTNMPLYIKTAMETLTFE